MESEDRPEIYVFDLVKIGLAFFVGVLLLPLLVNSGAFSVLPILAVYWLLSYKSKKNREKYQSATQIKNPRRILIEELSDGNFAVYDYESLERLTSHSYKNANNARIHMKTLYPAAHITIR